MTNVTIVTGASRGIGRAIVNILLKNPENKVIAVARTKEALESLQKQYGDRIEIVAGDITESSTSVEAVKLAESKFGQLDAVIANAGVLDPVGPIEKHNINEWKRLFDINFFSVVELIQQSLPALRKTHGKFIAVSSGASLKPYSGWYAYGSSKASLNHLIASLASEESEIQAISIAPGVVDTEMQQDIREKFGKDMSTEGLQRFIDLHQNKQLSPPEVPAAVYANLALRGWSNDINGKYLRFDDDVLKSYA
ncbi:uncharacterized protein SPAPADRAFT_58166 [Spathaspora passalidarum NRRL Y-27907]|uniref:Uncharacterized protein n=1 Tax=Spathaspora passalidarum (strain NRRL Y-27907 / 11-Y1) TaxID=619300 RepID=G3AFP4_SPAPN|nr:uncharacterized protein SPAPADRAFT_58166 [Spathaspora passalidarum NRRL Y-27907]EGW35033.1 hypothetical protein SPAPADRAFT_58166 [Spathaspora passalidarum NRRL Y-27907]